MTFTKKKKINATEKCLYGSKEHNILHNRPLSRQKKHNEGYWVLHAIFFLKKQVSHSKSSEELW